MKRFYVGHIHADFVSMNDAIDIVCRAAMAQSAGFVVTPNVDHVVLAERNAALRNAYESAMLSLADGMPLIWASRLFGHPLPGKISGSDLVAPLLARAAQERLRVYFLGAAPGVGTIAAEAAVRRYPGLQIVGVDAPPLGFERDSAQEAATKEKMLAASPDIAFVALGCPKQEILMHRWSREAGMPVMLGIGASLDFLAGKVRRAPPTLSRLGLEWLFRLTQDPIRLAKRYLVRDMAILPILARMALHPRGPIVHCDERTTIGVETAAE